MSPDDRRPPITPQLALRVAILGGIALALFAVVFFRLWFLQVLSGDQYLVEARENRTRDVRIQAPRGEIVDRAGRVLVDRPSTIQRRAIEQLAVVPYSAVTVRSDVPRSVMNYLKERKETFPGVEVDRVFLRSYPRETLAAQLLGYVGEISPQELKQRRNRGVEQGTIVGKAGLEYTYDRYLRGRDGAKVLRVDANGRFSSDRPVARREPIPGRQLRLSLDVGLQKAGQEAVQAIGGGLPGAFVAMNPRNGEVYALGSLPTFDPSVFAKPISQSRFEQLRSEENGAPLYNRAIGGQYPSGSTFKPITSIAALEEGVVTADTPIADTGCMMIGTRKACNAGEVVNGPVDLYRALEVSSDIYYYKMGISLFRIGGERLQKWAKALGLGRESGIDLPDERAGLIPGKEWRDRINRLERKCRPGNDGEPCYVLDVRDYNPGDNANLAVGQGEVQISPLQMAIAYSTILTGGRVPRPHIGLEVQDTLGRPVQKIDPGSARRVKMDKANADAVLAGLTRSAQGPNGTSTPVFEDWPHDRYPVMGKTGTAERQPQADQSWYVGMVDHPDRPIVVAATIERGGWGAERAAPAVCRILREWYSVRGASCQAGGSHTR